MWITSVNKRFGVQGPQSKIGLQNIAKCNNLTLLYSNAMPKAKQQLLRLVVMRNNYSGKRLNAIGYGL
jgi:hypothetical protein